MSSSANMAPYACYSGSSLLAAALGTKTMHSSVPVAGGKDVIARVTAVAVSGETARGKADAKCNPRVFSMMLFDVPCISVKSTGAGARVSDDGSVATFTIMRRNKEDVERNRATDGGRPQRIGREEAGHFDLRLGSVFTCVNMGKGHLAIEMSRIYDLHIKELSEGEFGGRVMREFQVANFMPYGGGEVAPHINSLPGERFAMLVTALAEAHQQSPRLSPLVFAVGAKRPGEKESVTTTMLDPRCHYMTNYEWTWPFMMLPNEAMERLRYGMQTTITSAPIITLDAPKWPTRKRDDETGKWNQRHVIEYELRINQLIPRVLMPNSEPLKCLIQETQLDKFYVRTPEVRASISIWEDTLLGYGVMDSRHWYSGALAALVLGTPTLIHAYVARKNVLNAWPDPKSEFGLSFTACSAKKEKTKGPPPPCTAADNMGVLALVGVGAANTGYPVTHDSVIATLKALETREQSRYNPNMQVTSGDRKRIDGKDLAANPLAKYIGSDGMPNNVINVLESNVDWQQPQLAKDYDFLAVPNSGAKTSRQEPNAATHETMFISSEALKWYTKLVQDTGEDAAAARMGAIIEQFAKKVRNPPGAECFHFPEDSMQQHDFLLFAVRKQWRKAAGIDLLRNDNHLEMMKRCYRALHKDAPPASDAYIAELLQHYPAATMQGMPDHADPNSLTAASSSSSSSDHAMVDALHNALTATSAAATPDLSPMDALRSAVAAGNDEMYTAVPTAAGMSNSDWIKTIRNAVVDATLNVPLVAVSSDVAPKSDRHDLAAYRAKAEHPSAVASPVRAAALPASPTRHDKRTRTYTTETGSSSASSPPAWFDDK